MRFREVKRKPNGSLHAFDCDLVYRTDDALIVRYHATEEPFKSIAAMSEGYYWRGRNYLMYKMFNEDGDLIGYRFDVCRDVRIAENQVEWTDLYLDARVSPAGDVRIEDEDEVAEASARGELSAEDQRIIRVTRKLLETDYQNIIQEASELRARAS